MENFDLMAKDYDTDKRADRATVIADEIRRHVGAGKGSAIEFGCGTGLVGLQLADDFAELTLLDSSVEMVRQAAAGGVKLPGGVCPVLRFIGRRAGAHGDGLYFFVFGAAPY